MYSSSYFNLGPRSGWVVKATTRTLPPEKTSYLLCRRLDGPQDQSWRVQNISSPQGFDPRTVQPVASRYTDWAIPARLYPVLLNNAHIPFSQSFQKITVNKFIRPEERGSMFLRSIRTNILIKRGLRTRRDLDLCCAFGCFQFQI